MFNHFGYVYNPLDCSMSRPPQPPTHKRKPSDGTSSLSNTDNAGQPTRPSKNYLKSPLMPRRQQQKHSVVTPFQQAQLPKPYLTHRRYQGRSMDLDEMWQQQGHPTEQHKVTINKQYIHSMRKRGVISQMNDYPQPTPSRLKNKKKDARKKKPTVRVDQHQLASREVFTEVVPLRQGKRSSKGLKTHSKSHRPHSLMHPHPHSAEMFIEKRPKSSRMHANSRRLLNELKSIGASLPIASKLHSLFSNKSSMLSSSSDLHRFEKIHIPTEEDLEQLGEIRQFESMALPSGSGSSLIGGLQRLQSGTGEKKTETEDIISFYIRAFNSSENLQIAVPDSLERLDDLVESSVQTIDSPSPTYPPQTDSSPDHDPQLGQQIPGLEDAPVDDHQLEQSRKDKGEDLLVSIVNLIKDKELHQNGGSIESKIRGLIKTYSQNETHLPFQSRPQVSDNSCSNSELNTSSLKDSIEEKDLALLNLQMLDANLKQRETYLKQRLARELERLDESAETVDVSEEKERITKWIQSQVKEVSKTRKHLWSGFYNAKQLLKVEELNSKKKDMLRCLSEEYLHRKNLPLTDQMQPTQVDRQIKHQELLSSAREEVKEHEIVLPVLVKQQKKTLKPQDCIQSPQPNLQRRKQRLACEGDNTDSPYLLSSSSSSNSHNYPSLAVESPQHFQSSFPVDPRLLGVSPDDKEDICEFIFLDMCIQITEEYPPTSRVISTIRNYISQCRELSQRRKGFKTSTSVIKTYLSDFLHHLKDRPTLLSQVHRDMDNNMGPTTKDILRYMHDSAQPEEDEGGENFILSSDTFDEFEKTYLNNLKLDRYYDEEDKEKKRVLFIKNAIHIHNKAIFDAFNESLDRSRPFGIWGAPFAWKSKPKFDKKRTVQQKNEILLKSAQRTIESGSMLCGFMADKEDSALAHNSNLTQEYVERIRYDRLSRYLATDLLETEEKMAFLDDEETEILVALAGAIMGRLLSQFAQEVNAFVKGTT